MDFFINEHWIDILIILFVIFYYCKRNKKVDVEEVEEIPQTADDVIEEIRRKRAERQGKKQIPQQPLVIEKKESNVIDPILQRNLEFLQKLEALKAHQNAAKQSPAKESTFNYEIKKQPQKDFKKNILASLKNPQRLREIFIAKEILDTPKSMS